MTSLDTKTIMKQVVIFLILILAPLAASSQNNETIATNKSVIIKIETTNSTASVSNKRNHTYFAAQKEAVELNYKKSLDLISIKSFRKTTQLRSKDRRRC